jgi:PAS domain S-box-containing protein
MLCRFRQDGTLTYVNQFYSQFFGKEPYEFYNVNLFSLIDGTEEQERIKSRYLSLTQEKPFIMYEVHETNSRGEKRWVQWTDRLIFNDDAMEVEYQSIGMDITERKLAEIERERLLKSEHEQRLRAETSAEATLALVSHLEQNDVLNEILNQVQRLLPGCGANIALVEGELLHTTAWRGYENRGNEIFEHLVKNPHMYPLDMDILQNPRTLIVTDTHQASNWKIIPGLEWIRSHLCIPLLWNNQLLGLLYIDEDTPNKFSEETIKRLTPLVNATTVALESALLIETTRQALKETSALYHINQGLVALNADELLKDAVELLQNNFNYYHVQVFVIAPDTENFILKAASGDIGKKLVEEKHEVGAGTGIIGYAAETGSPFFTNNVDQVVYFSYDPNFPDTTAEMAVPVRNGEKLYGVLDIQQNAYKQFTQRDLQLVVTIADQLAVALHKAELYENLQTALQKEKAIRNQLVQNERLAVMGRLLASVSHELNNPLQAIQNALFLLKEEKGMSEQGLNDLEIVLAESERMAGLIERLRDTYRPPQAEDLQPTYINNIIEDVYALLATHLRKNMVAFEFHPDPEAPAIMALPDQVRQVALNLLMNAVEAMPDGGKLTVNTMFLRDSHEIMLSVMDTGSGISPSILPYIFDPFVTNKKRGTGIGLTISHDIVIKHRGRITAENNPDSGATFKVWLPIEPATAEHA